MVEFAESLQLTLVELQLVCTKCGRVFLNAETVYEDNLGRRFCVTSGCAIGETRSSLRAVKVS